MGLWTPPERVSRVPRRSTAGSEPFDERLWVPWWWWALPVFFLWTLWLAYDRTWGRGAALAVTAVAVAVVAATLVTYGRARIRLTGTELRAGRARFPLCALGRSWPLDPEQARQLRGPGADGNAFLLLRAYLPAAVRVDITDPDDPRPYAYLSTRRPDALAAALNAAVRPTGAHRSGGRPESPG